MGKGSTRIEAPDPVDPAQAQGEYLFGQGFGNFQGVTDPRLQQRLISAEQTFRPQYTALELADIGTMARGIKDPKQTAEYKKLQTKLAGLQSGEGVSDSEATKIAKRTLGPPPQKTIKKKFGKGKGGRTVYRDVANPDYKKQINSYNAELSKLTESLGGNRKAQISQIKSQMRGLEKAGGTAGLFDLLEESSVRAADLQRQQLGQQRAADVAALRRFAPQVVQAYRDADPTSTALAEAASRRAGVSTPSTRSTGGKGSIQAPAPVQVSETDSLDALREQGESLLGSRVRSSSAAERQLKKMGMTLGDLSPTEQEALISGRGTEFIQSTGELSPLEQRRAQQSARQASLARGREMGQGALAQEIANRFAEETNKREREIALGAQLLNQEAGMRGSRLGQGAGMLQGSEALAAQRRAEQLQRMQLGAGFIGQEEGLQSARLGQAFGMNRQLAGDAGNIILGRPSAAIGLGQQTLGQAQQGAAGPMGPQLFDPNVGINLAMQNQANQFGLLGAQAQADASRSAGFTQALGTIGAAMIPCWVAREVYGIENPKWVQFRNWMLNDSPSWFRNLYIKYGERFAKFISNKPVLKNIIRKWMNTKIK